MKLLEDAFDYVGRLLDMLHAIDGHGDLANLQFFPLVAPAGAIGNQPAKADPVGSKGDIGVAIIVLGGEARAESGRWCAKLGHADYCVIMPLAYLDRLSDWVFDRKECCGRLGRQYDHIGE